MNKIELPTGYLFTDQYSKGQLETLSIGDYGKAHNIKADFLGYSRPLNGVANTVCMPLQEKWVITLSTQYGCTMKCKFCSVPNVPFHGNASFGDLKQQLYSAIACFPSVKYTDRLNIHFARMGEPIFNSAVFEFAIWLYKAKLEIYKDTGLRIEVIHPVLTTSLPSAYKPFFDKVLQWCDIKNELYNGQAGLQFSINSTNDVQRNDMFCGMSHQLETIAELGRLMPYPVSRKYCLNFALATGYEVDANRLRSLFDPEKFMVKITPIHNNNECRANGIETLEGYESFAPYKKAEQELIEAGFDVLIFVPSMDEEQGTITCGNVVLGGSVPTTTKKIDISGLVKN